MVAFFEAAGSFLLDVILLAGGLLGAVTSALKARGMNLSRVNEHGVRVWKNAADSFIAPIQINLLWGATALFALMALVGALRLSGQSQPSSSLPQQQSSTETQAVVPYREQSNAVARAEFGAAENESTRTDALNGILFPQSDERVLTHSDVALLTVDQLRLARNEIFARRGRSFADPALRAHFEQFGWYHPTDAEAALNEFESANVRFLQAEEAAREGDGVTETREVGATSQSVGDELMTANVYGLVVRRATSEELAELGIRRPSGLVIVGITDESLWQGSRPDELPPSVGDIILSGIGGGTWENPSEFLSYATRPYRVCVDARKSGAPRTVTAFCRSGG